MIRIRRLGAGAAAGRWIEPKAYWAPRSGSAARVWRGRLRSTATRVPWLRSRAASAGPADPATRQMPAAGISGVAPAARSVAVAAGRTVNTYPSGAPNGTIRRGPVLAVPGRNGPERSPGRVPACASGVTVASSATASVTPGIRVPAGCISVAV